MTTNTTTRSPKRRWLGGALVISALLSLLVGPATAQSSSGSESVFVPLSPARILDTRNGIGGTGSQPLAREETRVLLVHGRAGVPSDATAVVLNVTAVEATADSFLTVYPTGGARPNASNLNFGPGDTLPNLVVVKIGAGGQISFFNNRGSVDVIADVAGYFEEGSAAVPSPNSPTVYRQTVTSVRRLATNVELVEATCPAGFVATGGTANGIGDVVPVEVIGSGFTSAQTYGALFITIDLLPDNMDLQVIARCGPGSLGGSSEPLPLSTAAEGFVDLGAIADQYRDGLQRSAE